MTITRSLRVVTMQWPLWAVSRWHCSFTRFGQGEGAAWRWNGQWQWWLGPWCASYVRGQNDRYGQ
jgi:hypothetical protein